MSGWFAPPEMRWDFLRLFWTRKVVYLLQLNLLVIFENFGFYLCVKMSALVTSLLSQLLRSPSKPSIGFVTLLAGLLQCRFGRHRHCCLYRSNQTSGSGSFFWRVPIWIYFKFTGENTLVIGFFTSKLKISTYFKYLTSTQYGGFESWSLLTFYVACQ